MSSIRNILTSNRGSNALELALIAPVIGLLICILVVVGRLASAGNTVENAAIGAAREASLSRSTAAAQAAATTRANTILNDAGVKCSATTVAIDDTGINAALGDTGIVRADLTCIADLSDIGMPGLPGHKTLTATATSPVDPHRER